MRPSASRAFGAVIMRTALFLFTRRHGDMTKARLIFTSMHVSSTSMPRYDIEQGHDFDARRHLYRHALESKCAYTHGQAAYAITFLQHFAGAAHAGPPPQPSRAITATAPTPAIALCTAAVIAQRAVSRPLGLRFL